MNKKIPDLPFIDYVKLDAINNSSLGLIKKSPKYYHLGKRINSEGFGIGRATHTFVLEPDKFEAEYNVVPVKSKNTKAWKEAKENYDGREMLTLDEIDLVKAMAETVSAHPVASQLLDGFGAFEPTYLFDYMGHQCKCRLDFEREDGVIVDLKTTVDSSNLAFEQAVKKYQYYRQVAFYKLGYTVVNEKPPEGFYFVAVEKKEPYHVAVYEIDADYEQYGLEEAEMLLTQLKTCKSTDNWPGINDDQPVTLFKPAYLK